MIQYVTAVLNPFELPLGLFFASETARTIFDDVCNGANFTIAHIQAAAALVAAIASGHLVLPALGQRRVTGALGLVLIFLTSTGYIVTNAGARNAEVDGNKAALVVKNNEERLILKDKVAEAERDAEEAKLDAANECSTGKASRCTGRTETRDYAAKDLEKAESHAAIMRGKLSLLGPEEQPNAGYKHAALMFEAANLGNAAMTEARLELPMPFMLVLISEFGTLVFLSLAMGRHSSRGNHQQNTLKSATKPATNHTWIGNPRVAKRSAAEFDVMQLLARGAELPCQNTLIDRWAVNQGTVSKWLCDFERRGLIVRCRDGRMNRVLAA